MVLADDLVQETLLRAVHKQHLWQPGTDLHAWLFMIMHNQYVNQVKRIMRDSAIIELNECAHSLVATTDPTASRQLRELERALGELPEEQREVILLVGLEGMSYDQAAAILNVPVGTIRAPVARARSAAQVAGYGGKAAYYGRRAPPGAHSARRLTRTSLEIS